MQANAKSAHAVFKLKFVKPLYSFLKFLILLTNIFDQLFKFFCISDFDTDSQLERLCIMKYICHFSPFGDKNSAYPEACAEILNLQATC